MLHLTLHYTMQSSFVYLGWNRNWPFHFAKSCNSMQSSKDDFVRLQKYSYTSSHSFHSTLLHCMLYFSNSLHVYVCCRWLQHLCLNLWDCWGAVRGPGSVRAADIDRKIINIKMKPSSSDRQTGLVLHQNLIPSLLKFHFPNKRE